MWIHTRVFLSFFTKGDNFYDFMFASPEDEILPRRNLLLKGIVCSPGANSFL